MFLALFLPSHAFSHTFFGSLLTTMDVPANPASVMDFYWRKPVGENVSFFYFSVLPQSLLFQSCSFCLTRFLLYTVVAENTGPLVVHLWLKSVHETPTTSSTARPPSGQNRPDQQEVGRTTSCEWADSSRKPVCIILLSSGRSFSVDS